MEEIKSKANYCLNCVTKPCSNKGCPLNNNIPGFIKAIKEENKVKTDENQNEKDEIIQKINDILSVLEYERLEEVLKYVKRKKNQKK